MSISTSVQLGKAFLTKTIQYFIVNVDMFPTTDKQSALASSHKILALINILDDDNLTSINNLRSEILVLHTHIDTPEDKTTSIFNTSHQLELLTIMCHNEIQSINGVGGVLEYGPAQNTNMNTTITPVFETEIISLLSPTRLWHSATNPTSPESVYGYDCGWLLGELIKQLSSELGDIMSSAGVTSTLFEKVDPDYEIPDYSGNEDLVDDRGIPNGVDTLYGGSGYTNGSNIELEIVSEETGRGGFVFADVSATVVTNVTYDSTRQGDKYRAGETVKLSENGVLPVDPATVNITTITPTSTPTSPGQEDPTAGDGVESERVVPDFLTDVDEGTPNYMADLGFHLNQMAINIPAMNALTTISDIGSYRASLEEARTYIDGIPFVADALEQDIWLLLLWLSNQCIWQDYSPDGTREIPVP